MHCADGKCRGPRARSGAFDAGQLNRKRVNTRQRDSVGAYRRGAVAGRRKAGGADEITNETDEKRNARVGVGYATGNRNNAPPRLVNNMDA